MNELGKIEIKNLEIYAYHGVHESEKEKGQTFFVDAKLQTDIVTPGISDQLEDTVNYSRVCENINHVFTADKYDLIEKAAMECAKSTMLNFPKVREVQITVHKPSAPIKLPFGDVSVTVALKWHKAYLSIGSNMGDSEEYLNQAVDALYNDENCRVLQVSDYIITKPVGPVEQEDFLNGCVEIETLYSPQMLLKKVNIIEQEAGRTREIHWGPRTLDIDIILYDQEIVCDPNLYIPHREMHRRAFVLYPLTRIAPYAINPVLNKTVSQLLNEMTEQEKKEQGFETEGCAGCKGCIVKR